MYYVALIPPPPVSGDVLKWKKWMEDRFGCVVAQRSPAHVTLIPPFWMKEDLEPALLESLSRFASARDPFPLRLNRFGHFRPRVIYLNVEPAPELSSLRTDLFTALFNFPVPHIGNDFTPHVTIATRDLRKKDFSEAWDRFNNMNYDKVWLCCDISLLRHNKKKWDVIATPQFR
ncbi:MAG TPA: 2'-5' RNA ligase family protein [Chitinophagaceae bacterium]|nr:2'-5' RNA ligase family protein [Chitinophagaceae bacterium]